MKETEVNEKYYLKEIVDKFFVNVYYLRSRQLTSEVFMNETPGIAVPLPIPIMPPLNYACPLCEGEHGNNTLCQMTMEDDYDIY